MTIDMIRVGSHERKSKVSAADIDLTLGEEAIDELMEAVRRYGEPLTPQRFPAAYGDFASDIFDQRSAHMSVEAAQRFEHFLDDQILGTAVRLRMKPRDSGLHGTLQIIGEAGLLSGARSQVAQQGYRLGAVSLRYGIDDPEMLADALRLDIDLHSEGYLVANGSVSTHFPLPEHIWKELQFDELTPLEPQTDHEIQDEPLGNRQVQAVTSFVLARMPA